MPSIDQMFPPKFLSYKLFEPGELMTMTIRAVQLAKATAVNKFYGRAAHAENDVEADWLIFFEEHRLPMRLKVSKAKQIAAVLGSSVSEDWIGRKISIYRGFIPIGGEQVEGLLIDSRPPITPAGLLDHARKGKIVPKDNMDRFRGALSERGKTFDDFLRWLKDKDAHAFAAAFGEAMDAFPATLVPAMKAYLDFLHNPPPDAIESRPSLTQGNPSAASLRDAVGVQPESAGPSISHQAKEFVNDDIPF